MKKVIGITLICACFIGLLCGCDIQINLGNTEKATESAVSTNQETVSEKQDNATTTEYQDKENAFWDEMNLLCYEVFAADPSNLSVTSMTDGRKNYFYVKLGEIHNVPVFVDAAYHHDGRTEMVYQWEQASMTEERFINMTSDCVNRMTNASVKASVNTSMEAGVKAGYASASARVSAGLEATLGTAYSQSSIQSSTNSLNKIIQDSQSQTITILKNSPEGYYRYTVYGNMAVYAEVVCDLSSRQVEYSYVSVPIANSYISGLWYTKDGNYDKNDTRQLTLTEDILSRINLFDNNIANKTDDCIYGQAEFWDTQTITVVDNGAYGLEQPHLTDTVDLSALTAYMTEDYQFQFDISVKSECKKIFGVWIDGSHEIHLYNQYNEKVSNSAETVSEQIAREKYGLVYSQIWTQRNGENAFRWTVSGEDCRANMYLCYDAQGDGDDTWYCRSIYVKITVTKKS